jgi:hypothetical protein
LAKQAVGALRTHVPSWILLSLLLSAHKQNDLALATCDAALAELSAPSVSSASPSPQSHTSLDILLLKARLLVCNGEYDQAITCFITLCGYLFEDTSYRSATPSASRRPYVVPVVKPYVQSSFSCTILSIMLILFYVCVNVYVERKSQWNVNVAVQLVRHHPVAYQQYQQWMHCNCELNGYGRCTVVH